MAFLLGLEGGVADAGIAQGVLDVVDDSFGIAFPGDDQMGRQGIKSPFDALHRGIEGLEVYGYICTGFHKPKIRKNCYICKAKIIR